MHQFAERRSSFGTVAAQYDAVRPGYPPRVIADLLAYAGLGAGASALEIGAGTGQATLQFAAAGIDVCAVEPSAEMVEILRERAVGPAGSGTVEAVVSEFETFEPFGQRFDLVFAATSWHWLDEGVRWERALDALHPGGTLAALWNWPLWRRTSLCPEFDEIYRESGAKLDELGVMATTEPTAAALAREWLADAPATGVLSEARAGEYSWSASYTASQYVALINTYADHIALESSVREHLALHLTAAISRHGGLIELPYKTMLLMTRCV
jgi:SAM-dependent methyltransferase